VNQFDASDVRLQALHIRMKMWALCGAELMDVMAWFSEFVTRLVH
jgi:hypothetical protein